MQPELVVMHHTDCGLTRLVNPAIQEQVAVQTAGKVLRLIHFSLKCDPLVLPKSVGLKHPDTTDVQVIKLNLDTLEVAGSLPLGKDKNTLYIGKPGKDGVVHVGKMGSGQVVAIDAKSFKVLNTWDVPVNGDVVCDADVVVGSDGVERFYYPTR